MVGYGAGIGLALGLFGAGATPAAAQERVVSDIPYVTCDSSRWRVALDGDAFVHTSEAGETHEDNIMRYRTWDGTCWQASWSAYRRSFFHIPVGAGRSHPDTILNFQDWDGELWTARREGDDWIVVRP